MAKEKCPICGGKVYLEYCEDCGYRVPVESDISSIYNYDPLDYPVPNAPDESESNSFSDEKFDILKKNNVDEIYPKAQKAPERAHTNTPFANAEMNKPISGNNPNMSVYQNQNQPANIQNNNTQNNAANNANPYANVNYKNYNQQNSSQSNYVGEFIKTQFFKIFMTVFFGGLGIILGFVFMGNFIRRSTSDRFSEYDRSKYKEYAKYMAIVFIAKFALYFLYKLASNFTSFAWNFS